MVKHCWCSGLTTLQNEVSNLYTIIRNSDPITSIEMCCTDVFWWYSHIIERVKKRQTVIYARGRQTVLPFHFKENLSAGSGTTGMWVQWLNQSWSQSTRSFTKLQLMLPCVSIIREKIKASSSLSNSCSNPSRILQCVRKRGAGGGSKTCIWESA